MLGLHLEIDENSPPASTNFTNLFRSALCMPQMLMHRWKDSLLWIMLALLITQCMSVRIIPAQAQAMSAKHATTGPGMTTTALIDSGCSTTASGRRSLFPKRRTSPCFRPSKCLTSTTSRRISMMHSTSSSHLVQRYPYILPTKATTWKSM